MTTTTCPTCHEELPRGKNKIPMLVCPRCLAAKNYQDILQSQKQFLPRLLQGEHPIGLTRPAAEPKWHMAMVGYQLSWCGAWLEPAWKNKKHLPYPQLSNVCEACWAAFHQLAQELSAEVANE